MDDPPKRCLGCFRPVKLCFCQLIPEIKNRTDLLILQHRRERFHPFNTARIVNQSLDRCRLMVGHISELANRFDAVDLKGNVGLLFPGDNVRLLTELAPHERPSQLVVPDGTWHHVKTLMREIPRLQKLPRYCLAPESPSRYRIRREPHAHGLSTLEAVVSALRSLEPETSGLDRLLNTFDRMISDQIKYGTPNWRHNERRRGGLPNVPRILMGDLSNIVVAYGEHEVGYRHGLSGSDQKHPGLIYWMAIRLGTGERFQCAIESESLRDQEVLSRLRLSPNEIRTPVSVDGFRDRWKEFLRPADRVAVYHHSTARILDSVCAHQSPTLILKSINVDSQWMREDDTRDEPQQGPGGQCISRASRRLANAVALVKSLEGLCQP